MGMSKYDNAREAIMHLISGAVSVEVDIQITEAVDVMYNDCEKSEPTETEFVQVTMQQMIDHGLNGFAVKLLSESITDKKVTKQIKFKYKNVGITISPLTEKE